ncbi:TPM domain-containing protein [Chitinophaga sancti]|uniref:TLP18.3, Psb32 and MOLO-1 founding protein of phosphatase n=1 Tax=Chitinophaga sancti TaxID=1004 RepID=A0A1K1SVW1_9BACT|nr:TPM domain-containing protein [Chitinophaga sancti]WQD61093.1 TPM domain-containing protein [Chitinophaga sancti]WQG86778.1 TPM domain-containing protein [Chitinophaga sancti]SFW88481.1 TLP18.3, Psb32 and MOLO-1 founding protein of phosphatase [Chitinophaga sancti]
MRLFPKKELLTEAEKQQLVQAIRHAERMTSGEIRVFVESHCKFVDPLDRAQQIFVRLSLEKTRLRNGVLLYFALKDKQYAIAGDKGIHEKVGQEFWKEKSQSMLAHFAQGQVVKGIAACIIEIGEALCVHFPHEGDDINELPDDIVVGR